MKPGLLSALRRFIRDTTGQDMVEYALLAGFVAVAAGASLPGIAHNLEHIYKHVKSVVVAAARAGGNKATPMTPDYTAQ